MLKQKDILNYLTQHKKEFQEKSILHYKIKNPKLSATTLDFNLESDSSYKLFQDVDDVQSYAKELRTNAWK